jgi:DNA-binding transcriptional LysR family regulator
MGVSFMSEHAVALEVDIGRLAVLNVDGFPAMRQWFVVHRRSKRLPPVAVAFRQFLLAEGARWIERATHVVPRRAGARRATAATAGAAPAHRK